MNDGPKRSPWLTQKNLAIVHRKFSAQPLFWGATSTCLLNPHPSTSFLYLDVIIKIFR